MRNIVFAACTVLIQFLEVNSYGNGAPTTVCTSQQPGHGSQPNSVSPYSLTVSATTYTPGGSLTVNVNGGDYQGIILQARVQGTSNIVGTFSSPPANTKMIQCSAASDTMTHSSTATKTASSTFTWQAPSSDVGSVEFVATVAQAKNTWWKNVKSAALAADSGTTSSPDQVTTQSINSTADAEGNTTTSMPGNATEGAITAAGTVKFDDSSNQAQNNSSATGATNSPETTTKNGATTLNKDVFNIFLLIGSVTVVKYFWN